MQQHKPKSSVHGRIMMSDAEAALLRLYTPFNERLATLLSVSACARGEGGRRGVGGLWEWGRGRGV
jgi:hypothetical protein